MASRKPKTTSRPVPQPVHAPQPMDTSTKIAALQRLLDLAEEIKVRDSDDPAFKTWKNTIERTLIRVYGQPSPEVEQFNQLRFFYHAIIMTLGEDYSHEHRRCFDRDFQILTSSLRSYIEELQQSGATTPTVDASVLAEPGIARVFISHASADAPLVEELVELLEIIGIRHDQIFCSSFPGYGIDLGDNFLEALKAQLLNRDALVLFVLTKRFYASAISLCEMGATWVLAKEHIPILVPPFDFDDVKGVIPLTQGFKLNDALKLNLFKAKVESTFGIESGLAHVAWERKRDRVLDRINAKIASIRDSH
jgi:hypothetical protein